MLEPTSWSQIANFNSQKHSTVFLKPSKMFLQKYKGYLNGLKKSDESRVEPTSYSK